MNSRILSLSKTANPTEKDLHLINEISKKMPVMFLQAKKTKNCFV